MAASYSESNPPRYVCLPSDQICASKRCERRWCMTPRNLLLKPWPERGRLPRFGALALQSVRPHNLPAQQIARASKAATERAGSARRV